MFQIWYPELLLLNGRTTVRFMDRDEVKVTGQYNGHVTWYAGDVMSVTCLVDVTYFPYDRHSCQVVLMYDGDAESVRLKPAHQKILLQAGFTVS